MGKPQHGWVRPRPDGTREDCGGPTLCEGCRSEQHTADRCKRQLESLIGPIRTVARECGYAIAVHGSVARDIDLVAVPWSSLAFSAEYLYERVVAIVAKHNFGAAYDEHGLTTVKPHGRRAGSIHLGGGPYIDLSVMPRIPEDV